MRRTLRFVGLGIVALGMSVQSTALLAQGSPAEDAACRPDVMRLCRAAAPDMGRVLACLQSQRARLSKPCLTVLRNHGQL